MVGLLELRVVGHGGYVWRTRCWGGRDAPMEAAGRLEYYPRSATPEYGGGGGLSYVGSETIDGVAGPSEVIGESGAEDSRAIRGADATRMVAWR